MTNKAKNKGTSYETSLLPLLREYYPGAERRTLSGAKDKGDFITPGSCIAWEAKNQKTMALGTWINEAIEEAKNLGVPYGAVIHKRYGKTDPAEQYLTMRLGDFLKLINGA